MLVSRCSCAVPVKLRVRRIVGYRWSLWFRRFWTKGSGSVTLRAASPRESTLPGKLLNADFFVLRARQGCHERDQIVDFILGQGKGLNIIIKPRVFQSVALVVMVNRIPERLH